MYASPSPDVLQCKERARTNDAGINPPLRRIALAQISYAIPEHDLLRDLPVGSRVATHGNNGKNYALIS
jgi:hypothetical protein